MTDKLKISENLDGGSNDENYDPIRANGDAGINLNESQPTEVDPCLPTLNGGSPTVGNGRRSFDQDNNVMAKGCFNLLESEKDEKHIYYGDNNYRESDGKGEKSASWENRIREKLGLTHCGFLIGLFLLCATLLFLLTIVVLGATWPHIPHRQQFPICTKSTCLRSSATILSKLDSTKSPCEDFYGFVCGEWIQKHSKPPVGRSKWNLEEELDLKMSQRLREVISVLPHQTKTNSLTWKIKNFYDSCMALDNIETDDERPLRKIITELGGWSVLRNFQVLSWEFGKTLVKLYDEYGVEPFFSIGVIPDPRNATENILKISPAALGLPHTSYYYRDKDDRVSSSYIRYLKDVARQLGATSTDANSFSQDMFYFERRIAEAFPSAEDEEDVRGHQIHKLSSLKLLAPSVPLNEILDAVFKKANIDDDTEILLPSTLYMTKISNIIATTDRSALNNYVIWNLVKTYAPYLNQNFQDLYSVYNRETTGASNLVDRWEFCIKTLESFMDVGLVAQIDKFDSPKVRSENEVVVGEIFETVRQVVIESITRAPWIDLELYKHFMGKLKNVTVQVGFPEAFLNSTYLEEYYSKLYVQTNNFFQNILYGVSFLKEEKRRRYVSPKEEYEWLSRVASDTKVVFIPSANKVVVPRKLLSQPYYEPEYPKAILYGTLGVEISRALVSSLLKYSGLYAANGSLIPDKSLIANQSLDLVHYQTKCLTNLTVDNGVETVEKANKTSLNTFAVLSAVRQALKALKKATAGSEHIHQAGLEDFDDDSLFYIAYGQSLFSVKTAQETDKSNTVDSSLDGKQMLDMVKLQVKSFSEAFNCQLPRSPCKHLL